MDKVAHYIKNQGILVSREFLNRKNNLRLAMVTHGIGNITIYLDCHRTTTAPVVSFTSQACGKSLHFWQLSH